MADIEFKRVPRIDFAKAGSLVGTRPRINLIEGSNVTLTVTDDAANDEVDVTVAASASGGGGLPLQLPVRNGAFYSSWYADVLEDASPDDVADAIFAIPFKRSEAKTWTRIGFHLTTGIDATSARLGIYSAHATTGFPDELVLDAGTISTALADNGTDREITISQALAADTLYWLTFVAEDPLIVIKMMTQVDSGRSVATNPLVGFATGFSTSIGRAPLGGYSTTTGWGALPDPFPDFNDMADPGTMPYIWLRVV